MIQNHTCTQGCGESWRSPRGLCVCKGEDLFPFFAKEQDWGLGAAAPVHYTLRTGSPPVNPELGMPGSPKAQATSREWPQALSIPARDTHPVWPRTDLRKELGSGSRPGVQAALGAAGGTPSRRKARPP